MTTISNYRKECAIVSLRTAYNHIASLSDTQISKQLGLIEKFCPVQQIPTVASLEGFYSAWFPQEFSIKANNAENYVLLRHGRWYYDGSTALSMHHNVDSEIIQSLFWGHPLKLINGAVIENTKGKGVTKTLKLWQQVIECIENDEVNFNKYH